MIYKKLLKSIGNRIETGEFISNFADYEPSPDRCELEQQLEYWIKDIEKLAEKNFREEILEVNKTLKRIADALSDNPLMAETPFMNYRYQMVLLANAVEDPPDLETSNRDGFPDSIRKILPKNKTIHERFFLNFEIIWADQDFWQLHHESDFIKCANSVHDYLANRYGMKFPFPPPVWQQMVAKPFHRKYFVNFMGTMPDYYFLHGSPHARKAGLTETERLKAISYLDILKNYLDYPMFDLKGYLAAQSLPEYALKDLRDLGKKLNVDAKWCINKNNEYVASEAKNIHRRLPSWERAVEREKMVTLLKSKPELTKQVAALAQTHFGIAEPKEYMYASEAIKLFLNRESFCPQN